MGFNPGDSSCSLPLQAIPIPISVPHPLTPQERQVQVIRAYTTTGVRMAAAAAGAAGTAGAIGAVPSSSQSPFLPRPQTGFKPLEFRRIERTYKTYGAAPAASSEIPPETILAGRVVSVAQIMANPQIPQNSSQILSGSRIEPSRRPAMPPRTLVLSSASLVRIEDDLLADDDELDSDDEPASASEIIKCPTVSAKDLYESMFDHDQRLTGWCSSPGADDIFSLIPEIATATYRYVTPETRPEDLLVGSEPSVVSVSPVVDSNAQKWKKKANRKRSMPMPILRATLDDCDEPWSSSRPQSAESILGELLPDASEERYDPSGDKAKQDPANTNGPTDDAGALLEDDTALSQSSEVSVLLSPSEIDPKQKPTLQRHHDRPSPVQHHTCDVPASQARTTSRPLTAGSRRVVIMKEDAQQSIKLVPQIGPGLIPGRPPAPTPARMPSEAARLGSELSQDIPDPGNPEHHTASQTPLVPAIPVSESSVNNAILNGPFGPTKSKRAGPRSKIDTCSSFPAASENMASLRKRLMLSGLSLSKSSRGRLSQDFRLNPATTVITGRKYLSETHSGSLMDPILGKGSKHQGLSSAELLGSSTSGMNTPNSRGLPMIQQSSYTNLCLSSDSGAESRDAGSSDSSGSLALSISRPSTCKAGPTPRDSPAGYKSLSGPGDTGSALDGRNSLRALSLERLVGPSKKGHGRGAVVGKLTPGDLQSSPSVFYLGYEPTKFKHQIRKLSQNGFVLCPPPPPPNPGNTAGALRVDHPLRGADVDADDADDDRHMDQFKELRAFLQMHGGLSTSPPDNRQFRQEMQLNRVRACN
ncbi:uncharacterized protein BJ171DRAFT_577895 [Polychytrium aggregatum]|uniref:uncharacterized protein n=1 Tax=Polychytrium aggregatum TaxID=110093 RepID=UPI0022FF2ED6|nr:uncharacterized protein BJ171DRAFT_577895 [Polychytrium aggregatum]KAI9208078.1 hypothetical protein BJ171DRAFT_577895 [Polychytrium aggregatum]